MIITLDGPSGSGKSTLAQKVACHLNYYYVNTGFLYRAIAYALLHTYKYTHHEDVSVEHLEEIERNIVYHYIDCKAGITYKNTDITSVLKNPEVTTVSSLIAQQQMVRDVVFVLQKKIAQQHNIVIEGRDIGSHVFPDAQYKFYVTADEHVRAERLQKDLQAKNIDVSVQEALSMVQQRDDRDRTRKIAPLIIPDHAIIIDTSMYAVDDLVQDMLNKIIK